MAKFSTPQGDLMVYFPGDAAAGDRISGTVITKPTGKNEKQLEKNQGRLEGYVVEMKEDPENKTVVKADQFRWLIPQAAGGIINLVLRDSKGASLASAAIPVNPEPVQVNVPSTIKPTDYRLPEIIQSGMPASISGHFNSDLSNTVITVGKESAMVLAESPRKCIFVAPDNVVGPNEIVLSEGGVTASAPTNSLDLKLNAERLSLNKGERTALNLLISGLEGVKKPVPFVITNESPGTINLSGGNYQELMIQPGQVTAAGTYQQQFTVSAINAGSFSIAAQVTPTLPESILADKPPTPNFQELPKELEGIPSEELEHIKTGNNKTKYIPKGYIHIDRGNYATQYYNPDIAKGYEHVKVGNQKSIIIPEKFLHIETTGTDRTKYYPPGNVHLTGTKDYSKLVPAGHTHISKGPDATKYKPDGGKHIEKGPDATKYEGNFHVDRAGDDWSKNEKSIKPPVEAGKKEVIDPPKPVKPITQKEKDDKEAKEKKEKEEKEKGKQGEKEKGK